MRTENRRKVRDEIPDGLHEILKCIVVFGVGMLTGKYTIMTDKTENMTIITLTIVGSSFIPLLVHSVHEMEKLVFSIVATNSAKDKLGSGSILMPSAFNSGDGIVANQQLKLAKSRKGNSIIDFARTRANNDAAISAASTPTSMSIVSDVMK